MFRYLYLIPHPNEDPKQLKIYIFRLPFYPHSNNQWWLLPTGASEADGRVVNGRQRQFWFLLPPLPLQHCRRRPFRSISPVVQKGTIDANLVQPLSFATWFATTGRLRNAGEKSCHASSPLPKSHYGPFQKAFIICFGSRLLMDLFTFFKQSHLCSVCKVGLSFQVFFELLNCCSVCV